MVVPVESLLIALAGLVTGLLVGLVIGFRAGFLALRVAARVIAAEHHEPAGDDIRLAA